MCVKIVDLTPPVYDARIPRITRYYFIIILALKKIVKIFFAWIYWIYQTN